MFSNVKVQSTHMAQRGATPPQMRIIIMNYAEHIADLIEQLVADNYGRQKHFNIWEETKDESAKEMWLIYTDRVEKTRAELTAHGFDMKAADDRRVNKLLGKAA